MSFQSQSLNFLWELITSIFFYLIKGQGFCVCSSAGWECSWLLSNSNTTFRIGLSLELFKFQNCPYKILRNTFFLMKNILDVYESRIDPTKKKKKKERKNNWLANRLYVLAHNIAICVVLFLLGFKSLIMNKISLQIRLEINFFKLLIYFFFLWILKI